MKKPLLLQLDEAIKRVNDGERIVIGHAAVTPNILVEELVRQKDRFRDLTLFQLIYLGPQVHLDPECTGHIRVCSPFLYGAGMKDAVHEGRADFLPIHFSAVPSLFRSDGGYHPDWTFVQVTPKDERGRYSMSLSCDFTLPAARSAKKVMAVVNPNLPYIGGDNFLTDDDIDIIVEDSSAPYVLPSPHEGELDRVIAKHCASLIPDRATLQIGIGAIPDAVLRQLGDRQDLGIHTEMFSDGVMHLYERGVITGKYKRAERGLIVSSFVMGSSALYEALDHNQDFVQYPVDYTNNPHIIGQHPNFISINSCVEVDLYGQVCSEKINGRMFSGSGGQLDYVRGVRYSEGGKSILCMPSTAKNGTISRIVPNMHPQAVVTTPRNDIDYLVTEYGIASLFGRTEAQRALALAKIAHPNYREELEKSAYDQFAIKRIY